MRPKLHDKVAVVTERVAASAEKRARSAGGRPGGCRTTQHVDGSGRTEPANAVVAEIAAANGSAARPDDVSDVVEPVS